MPRAAFGTIVVEAVGFESHPSTLLPTLYGYENGTQVWSLQFARNDMLRAWLVFRSFLVIASEANATSQKAATAQSVGESLLTLQNYFNELLKSFQSENAPANEIQAVQTVLNDLTALKSKLQASG